MTPQIVFDILEGEFAANILSFGSHSWIFGFTKFGVPELFRIVFTKVGVLKFVCNC